MGGYTYSMTMTKCTAESPTVPVFDDPPRSYPCTKPAHHDGYHNGGPDGAVTWRDPTPVLGEPKAWHPNHHPHR